MSTSSASPAHVASALWATSFELGEGVIWDDSTGLLCWVDVFAGDVWQASFDGETLVRPHGVHVDTTVSAVAPAAGGGLLAIGHRDLFHLDEVGSVTHVCSLEGRNLVPAGHRLNDAACDPRGRLLVGTVSTAGRHSGNRLLSIDGNANVTPLRQDLVVSNGIAWSPDGCTVFLVDSGPATVWAGDYDLDTGRVSNWWESFTVDDGTPDGMTMDANGDLWVAMWGQGGVRRYTPEGRQVGALDVGAPHVSSVSFAGPGLAALVMTTARFGLTREQLEAFGDSGRLFIADVGVSGLGAAAAWGAGAAPDQSCAAAEVKLR